ncbi:MAG: FixH family protein [Myxococcales bacterium]|nr:FixH family protein [Myxococcales bacterium]
MRHLGWGLAVLVACSGDGVDLEPPGLTTDCTGAEVFVAGMQTESEQGHMVSLMTAAPAPPDVGDNTWTISISDDSGPVTGLPLVVRPWMPLHGHGLSPATYAGTDNGDGTYDIEMFDVIMPGLWEFNVDLAPGEEPSDVAVFPLCAEG